MPHHRFSHPAYSATSHPESFNVGGNPHAGGGHKEGRGAPLFGDAAPYSVLRSTRPRGRGGAHSITGRQEREGRAPEEIRPENFAHKCPGLNPGAASSRG